MIVQHRQNVQMFNQIHRVYWSGKVYELMRQSVTEQFQVILVPMATNKA